jgi:hypothetical protein
MRRNIFENASSEFLEKITMPLSVNSYLDKRKVKCFAQFPLILSVEGAQDKLLTKLPAIQ